MTTRTHASPLSRYTVLNAMQVGVIDCSPDADVATVARTMAEHETAHLVVVSPHTGEPVGILSTLDVARWATGTREA